MSSALSFRDVVKFYGSKCVVQSTRLEIPTGTVYGLLGRNGAGKSTLLKMAIDLVRADRGDITVLGHDSVDLPPEVKCRVAYTAEGHPLPGWMTVQEIVRFTPAFYPRWRRDTLEQLLAHFRLPGKSLIKTLSNGQRAQLSLAMALAIDPDLLILDDPTLGLDAVVRRDVLDAIVRFVQRPGRTVVISTHQMSDVERIADRVGVVIEGVVRVDAPVEVFRESIKKVHITFAETPPRFPAFNGLVDVRRDGKTLTAIVVDWNDRKRRLAEALDPLTIDVLDLSMEDAFVEYTRGRGTDFPDLLKEPGDEPMVRREGVGL